MKQLNNNDKCICIIASTYIKCFAASPSTPQAFPVLTF